jgi:hypothetical protein
MVGRGILLRLAEFCGPQSHGDGAVFAPFSTLRSGAAFWIALARGALPTGRPGRKDFGLTPTFAACVARLKQPLGTSSERDTLTIAAERLRSTVTG